MRGHAALSVAGAKKSAAARRRVSSILILWTASGLAELAPYVQEVTGIAPQPPEAPRPLPPLSAPRRVLPASLALFAISILGNSVFIYLSDRLREYRGGTTL